MKKYFFLLVLPFLFISSVKADTLQEINFNNNLSEYQLLTDNTPFLCTTGSCSVSQAETELLNYY